MQITIPDQHIIWSDYKSTSVYKGLISTHYSKIINPVLFENCSLEPQMVLKTRIISVLFHSAQFPELSVTEVIPWADVRV